MIERDEALSWYQDIYDDPDYKMGLSRKNVATFALDNVPCGTMLDVGCGRGEMVRIAQNMGFDAFGIEASRKMCDDMKVFFGTAQNIPFDDNAFDVVTMFDVLEHIPEQDIAQVLSELNRVAKKTVIITASDRSCCSRAA